MKFYAFHVPLSQSDVICKYMQVPFGNVRAQFFLVKAIAQEYAFLLTHVCGSFIAKFSRKHDAGSCLFVGV